MFDAIVLGTGGVGSAALFHLARRGLRVVGLDRFGGGHDRGSSHGRTRIIRQAYFEHTDYVPLLLRAYQLWDELEKAQGTRLLHQVGLLQIGAADGIVLRGVLDSARQHRLHVEQFSAAEVMARYPGFRVPPTWIGALEPRAGYLRVEQCVLAHLNEARKLGAELRSGVSVVGWQPRGAGVIVQTDAGPLEAERLVIAAGPWAGGLLGDLDGRIRLEVRRKPMFWFACDKPAYEPDRCPTFLFETPAGMYYGFPKIDELGVKVACHTGGSTVADPLAVRRDLDPVEQADVAAFVAQHLPGVSDRCTDHVVCMYTMTPDEHFIVDRHPASPQVVFAAGLSGHGFKFTCVLGEALADLAIDGRTALPIDFLSCARPALRHSPSA